MAAVMTTLSERDDHVLRTMSRCVELASITLLGDESIKQFKERVKNSVNVMASIRVQRTVHYLCNNFKHPWAIDLHALMESFGMYPDAEKSFYSAFMTYIHSQNLVETTRSEKDNCVEAKKECYALCYHETVTRYLESMLGTSLETFIQRHQQEMRRTELVSLLQSTQFVD